ncbi:MAG: hypothetical protein QN197_13255 [Armatimonadota bacterium]|nr:hypothetical protein [Armatimonadota bacterium]MDR7574353.1 hypothetical protein [Armatimonadota bacterium]
MKALSKAKLHTLAIPGTVSRTGLVLRPGLSFEEWDRVGALLAEIHGAVAWWVGDWYLYGKARYGERAAQAKEIGDKTGLALHTVQDYAWVASRFELSVRTETLPFGVYERLAGVDDQQLRYALAERAAREGWTVRQAREAVRDLGRVQAPPLPAGKFFVVLRVGQGPRPGDRVLRDHPP